MPIQGRSRVIEQSLFKCVEKIPYQRVIDIFYSDYEIPRNDYSVLLEYLNCDEIYRYYYPSKDNDYLKKGRLYSKGLQNLEKPIRGYLCDGLYKDLDIKKCYPSIIINLCKRTMYDGKLDLIEKYCSSVNVNNNVKNNVIAVIFGGERKLDNKLKTQIQDARSYLINKAKDGLFGNSDEFSKCKADVEILTLLLQLEEKRLIDKAIEIIEKNNVDIIALCFDGLIVDNKFDENLLDKLNQAVKPYQFVIKPWTVPKLNQVHKLENFNWKSDIDIDSLQNSSTIFHDINYLHQTLLPLFLNSIRISPTNIIIKEDESNFGVYSDFNKSLKFANKIFRYGDDKPIGFKELLNQYNRLICVKNINIFEERPRTFSTWKGWQFRLKDDIDQKKVENVTNFIKDIICNNDEEFYEYFLNWLACILQQPGFKTEIAIILSGLGGTGKSTLLDFLHDKIFGHHTVNKDAGLTSLTDKFNSNLEGKTLALLEELKSSQNSDWRADLDKIKDIITGKVMKVERKYCDSRTVVNALNIIGFTNYSNSIPWIAGNERRYFMFEISDKRRNDFKYFEKLNKSFTQDVADHFGSYLLKRDVTGVNLRNMPHSDLNVVQEMKWMHGTQKALIILWIKKGKQATYISTKDVLEIGYKYEIDQVKKLKGKMGFELREYLGSRNETTKKYLLQPNKRFDISEEKINYVTDYMEEIEGEEDDTTSEYSR